MSHNAVQHYLVLISFVKFSPDKFFTVIDLLKRVSTAIKRTGHFYHKAAVVNDNDDWWDCV